MPLLSVFVTSIQGAWYQLHAYMASLVDCRRRAGIRRQCPKEMFLFVAADVPESAVTAFRESPPFEPRVSHTD